VNLKQLAVMKLKLSPGKKLALIAMIERPDYNRRELSDFLNMDKAQLTNTAKSLQDMGLIKIDRVNGHINVKYTVLVKEGV